MLRLSPFEVEYEDIQINNHAIAPTVLKQNVTRQRMPERRLNKPLVFQPNTSQRNFVKEQWHQLLQWLLQITMLLTLEWEKWWSTSILLFTRPINTVSAHEPCKATHERNI